MLLYRPYYPGRGEAENPVTGIIIEAPAHGQLHPTDARHYGRSVTPLAERIHPMPAE